MTEQETANINLKLALEQAALQQSKAGVVDLQKQFDALKKGIQDTGKAADSAGNVVSNSVGGLAQAVDLDTKSVSALNEELKKGINLSASLRSGGGFAEKLGLGGLGKALQIAGDLEQVGASIGEAGTAAQTGLAAAGIGLSQVVLAAAPLAAILAAVAIAQQKYSAELERGEKLLNAAFYAQEKYYEDVEHLTTAQARQRLAEEEKHQKTLLAIQAERREAIIREAEGLHLPNVFIDLFKKGDQAGEGFLRGEKAMKAVFEAFDDVNGQLEKSQHYATRLAQGLEQGTFKGNEAIDVIADIFNTITTGAKKAHDAVEQQTKLDYAASQQFNKTFQDGMEERRKAAAQAAADEKAFRDSQDEAAVNATKRYNESVKAANEKEGQDKVGIQQKYAQKVADVIQKAIDDSSAALEKLEQTRADLLLNAARDEDKAARQAAADDLKIQIKEQRQERDDLIEHLNRVRAIQRQFQTDEREAAMDRNFAQLFKLQERKKDETQAEESADKERRRSHRQALQDEKQDAATQRAFERNERRIALQERLNDAMHGYQLDIQHAQAARQKALEISAKERDDSLRLAAQKRAESLAILVSQYREELRLAGMTRNELLKIWQEALNQARSMGYRSQRIQGPISETSPQTTVGSGGLVRKNFAAGGPMAAGQEAIVNEPGSTGNEGFSRDGRTLRFPGYGMFIPSQSGNVVRNAGGSPNINIEVNTQATDAREVGRIVRREVLSAAKKIGIA